MLRPCIVAGPKAPALADSMPWRQLQRAAARGRCAAPRRRPGVLPLMPDPGVPLQLVHHDDVADAIALAVDRRRRAGRLQPRRRRRGDAARGRRGHRHPVGPRSRRALAVAASAAVARLPLVPAAAEWLHIARTSVVMDTRRAKTVLGWQPRHTSRETLDELAAVL